MRSLRNLRTWTHQPLSEDVRSALLRIERLSDVAIVAAMPDVHLAKAVCVGAVVATRSLLIPDAVGGDIGCGMSAVCLGNYDGILDSKEAATRVLLMLHSQVPTASHSTRDAHLPDLVAQEALSTPALEKKKASVGRVQFATLGRGNHFVELQQDDDGDLWLMLHSGSRGIGQAIAVHHGACGALHSIPAATPEGQAYLADLNWALSYAKLSRRRMCESVVAGLDRTLGTNANWSSYVDCHHNFVRSEVHEGEELWVHRKGAISARQGELGIIPGSMGSCSYHVEGRGNTESLCSSSHGAGRCMSRTEARKAISANTLSKQMRGVWFDTRLAQRLRDEAPAAYKDIGNVMRAQKKLTRIVRQLRPVLVYKGG